MHELSSNTLVGCLRLASVLKKRTSEAGTRGIPALHAEENVGSALGGHDTLKALRTPA